jgi:mono/diheme cytochrome c family protein
VGRAWIAGSLACLVSACGPSGAAPFTVDGGLEQRTDADLGTTESAPEEFALVVAPRSMCTSPRTSFPDVPASHPASREVAELAARCITAGYPDGTFAPDRAVTREEFAAFVAKAFLSDTSPSRTSFRDVARSRWSADSIARGVAAGFFRGYPDGNFRPTAAMTREEAIASLVNGLGLVGGDGHLFSFDDAPSPWAVSAVSTAEVQGMLSNRALFSGRRLRAREPLTRGILASLLARAPQLRFEATPLTRGWSPAVQERWYHTHQGSRLLDYELLATLERADSRDRFFEPDSMSSFGFLYAVPPTDRDAMRAADELNPDRRLPIGFALDRNTEGVEYAGLTCATCHTSDLQIGGTRYRVDGGGGNVDVARFEEALLAAVRAALADPRKLERMASRSGQEVRALRTTLTSWSTEFSARLGRNTYAHAPGPGRVDAVTTLTNEILALALGEPRNVTPPTAPADIPQLWLTPELDWAQWAPIVHDALRRNLGEVMGVYATTRVDRSSGAVTTSADFENLDALEDWIKDLDAPRWTSTLGSADCTQASRGRTLYATHCASCHAVVETADRACGFRGASEYPRVRVGMSTGRFIPVTPVLQRDVGTDPNELIAFGTRRDYPGPYARLPALAPLMDAEGRVPGAALLSVVQVAASEQYFARFPANREDFLEGRDPSVRPTPTLLQSYRARPLDGICFTGPFLHNGSVRTLEQLLLPPESRARSFRRGTTDYDVTACGPRDAGEFVFDTAVSGNRATGHTYGTTLGAEDRRALLAYLRTL